MGRPPLVSGQVRGWPTFRLRHPLHGLLLADESRPLDGGTAEDADGAADGAGRPCPGDSITRRERSGGRPEPGGGGRCLGIHTNADPDGSVAVWMSFMARPRWQIASCRIGWGGSPAFPGT